MWLLRKDEPVTISWSGPTVDMPGGSSTDSTGKSPLKSTLVTPRAKAAVPITLLEPNGLSAPDSALELWKSHSRSSASDRQSGVKGKSVAGRVNFGGGWIIKQKRQEQEGNDRVKDDD